MAKAKKTSGSTTIALNKKAKFDYELSERIEAGLVLEGWEVKSARAGKVQLTDSYVLLKGGEAFLLGAHITPLQTASTHVVPDMQRTRKLLLHDRQLAHLHAAVSQKGYTCVCPAMYWKGHLIKCEIALAKGKAKHDKRETEKERDWQREKQRTMAVKNR